MVRHDEPRELPVDPRSGQAEAAGAGLIQKTAEGRGIGAGLRGRSIVAGGGRRVVVKLLLEPAGAHVQQHRGTQRIVPIQTIGFRINETRSGARDRRGETLGVAVGGGVRRIHESAAPVKRNVMLGADRLIALH